ncbi:MAG: sensor histidine kinase [Promethearchaeota archaeon]
MEGRFLRFLKNEREIKVLINNEFLSLTHYEEKELIGKDLFGLDVDLFEEKIKLMDRYRDLLNNKKIVPISTKIKPKNSPPLWIKIKSSLITLKNENYIQSVLRGLDKQKELTRKIEEAIKFKNELLSRTSHELKTPLISIMGFSNLLLELYSQEFKKDVISIIQEINRGSHKLEKIVDTLLKATYLSSEEIKFNPSKEDLAFLIRYTIKDFKGLYLARGIKVKLNIHEKMPIYLEKEKIYEVISNLIINAIKFSPPNTEIKVSSKITKDSYIISIRDQGIGLTEKEKSQIFKPFGKIERYGQGWDLQVGGTGMGLYISKKIIDLHNGKIWAESEGRDKGSVFYFSLPIRE